MAINGWLTIITVFTAFVALLPRESQVLLMLKTTRLEQVVFAVVVLLIIPLLILTPNLRSRFPELKSWGFTWGISPPNVAFAIFYVVLIWSIVKLMIKPKNQKPSEKLINFFMELLNEKSFPEFYKIFTNHTSPDEIKKHWNEYYQLIMHPKFLAHGTSYVYQYWKKFNEDDIKSVFRLFLNNKQSEYYKEIKENWNSYSLQKDKPFLNTVINKNIEYSLNNNLVEVLYDFAAGELRRQNLNSEYNQRHHYTKVREDEGYDLPIYYHLKFYYFLYATAIEKKSDSNLMVSFYLIMIRTMLENMPQNEGGKVHQEKTNYSWLIEEIGKMHGEWFNKIIQLDDDSGNYHRSMVHSFYDVTDELISAYEDNKIGLSLLIAFVHYNLLSAYYDNHNDNTLRSAIEEEFILKFRPEVLKFFLELSLDEKYAIYYHDLRLGTYRAVNDHEKIILERLRKFIADNQLWAGIAEYDAEHWWDRHSLKK